MDALKNKYYLNENEHKVHNGKFDENHQGWPVPCEHQVYLGEFISIRNAVSAAKGQYPNATGCKHCFNKESNERDEAVREIAKKWST